MTQLIEQLKRHEGIRLFPYKCTADKLTIDHVIPRSRGGKNDWLNLVTACKKCNQKKGNKTPEEAGMPLLKKPIVPKSDIFKDISKTQIIPR